MPRVRMIRKTYHVENRLAVTVVISASESISSMLTMPSAASKAILRMGMVSSWVTLFLVNRMTLFRRMDADMADDDDDGGIS